KKLIMLPSETMIWQPEFTDKTLSRKPGAVQLLSLVHALYEGNPQPVFANTEKLNDAVEELRQLLNNHHDLKVVETPIYGYVWLNMETAHQLELLSSLICRALRK
ncbi:hypothetical protein L3W68_22455, partial [Escherichia coli]|nr:hypothetical protein [Escherichia coli]